MVRPTASLPRGDVGRGSEGLDSAPQEVRAEPERGLSLQELGDRLRSYRRDAGKTLEEVARGTGLSASFLSLVENGRSDISLGRLGRLLGFYGLSLAGLMQPHDDAHSAARVLVARVDERRVLETADGVRTEFLADSLRTQVTHLLMTFEPSGRIDVEPHPIAGDGESFYLILEGEILVELDERGPVILRKGDSISLLHREFRGSRNIAHGKTVVYVEQMPAGRGRVPTSH